MVAKAIYRPIVVASATTEFMASRVPFLTSVTFMTLIHALHRAWHSCDTVGAEFQGWSRWIEFRSVSQHMHHCRVQVSTISSSPILSGQVIVAWMVTSELLANKTEWLRFGIYCRTLCQFLWFCPKVSLYVNGRAKFSDIFNQIYFLNRRTAVVKTLDRKPTIVVEPETWMLSPACKTSFHG